MTNTYRYIKFTFTNKGHFTQKASIPPLAIEKKMGNGIGEANKEALLVCMLHLVSNLSQKS